MKNINELVKFGRKHIAVNGNFYRVAKPTEEFWTFYKENKEELKKQGYSVYKHNEYGFCVYDWTDKTKATAEQIEQYKKEESEWEANRINCAWQQIVAEVEERGAYGETIKDCTTWEDIWEELERLYDNPKCVYEEDILLNIPQPFYFS